MSLEEDIRKTAVASGALTAPAYLRPEGSGAHGTIFLNALKRTIQRGRARLAIVSPGARLEKWALEGSDDPAELRAIAASEPAVTVLLVQEAGRDNDTPVTDIEDAIQRIGESRAAQLIRSVVAVTQQDDVQAAQARHVWTHAVYTAVAARAIARLVGEPNPEQNFMAALFFNVGELYLVQRLTEYRALDGAMPTPSNSSGLAGADPVKMSGDLLKGWGFPDEMIAMAGQYLGPFASKSHRIACVARQAALDYGYTYLEHRPDLQLLARACKGLRIDVRGVRSLQARVSADLNELLRSGP